jgi:hypothetical protein
MDTLSLTAWDNALQGTISEAGLYCAAGDLSYTDTISATSVDGSRVYHDTALIAISNLSVDVKINFQPQDTPIPQGYRADYGLEYGARDSLYTYGWSRNVTAGARYREGVEDLRLATLNHMQQGGASSWEIAVPNGVYSLTVAVGDLYHDSFHQIQAEDTIVLAFTPDQITSYAVAELKVAVNDGRLTLRPGPQGANCKLCYLSVSGPFGQSNSRLLNPGTVGAPSHSGGALIKKGLYGIHNHSVQGTFFSETQQGFLLNGRCMGGKVYHQLGSASAKAPSSTNFCITIEDPAALRSSTERPGTD